MSELWFNFVMETSTKFGYFRTDEWIGIKFNIVSFIKFVNTFKLLLKSLT
jgi:hypothetical protein